MAEEIRVLKLVTGEEVIARVEDATQDGKSKIRLNKPRIVVIGQHPSTGQLMNQLVPYCACDPEDGTIVMSPSVILGEVINIPEPLVKIYTEQTTGIALT